jgi:LacI family transcriptional regulator
VTVSKVLRGAPGVSEEVRQQVLEAAEAHHYRPNRLAYQLLTQRTQMVGLAISSFSQTGMAQLLEGACSEASRQGYLLVLSSPGPGAGDLRDVAVELSCHRPDAVIFQAMQGMDWSSVLEPINEESIPIVVIGPVPEEYSKLHRIGIDHQDGARQAVRHLLRKGHRRIAHISGAPRLGETHQMLRGYREALASAGIEEDADLLMPASSVGDIPEAVDLLLELPDRPTALFVAGDFWALEAIDRVAKHGLSVPRDVAVMGYGDEVPWMGQGRGGLSTVHVPWEALGQAAMHTALTLVQRPDYPIRANLLPGELRIRDSCGTESFFL